MDTTTVNLTRAQGQLLHRLIGDGYGAGNGYLPFDSHSAVVPQLVALGLVRRGRCIGFRRGQGIFEHDGVAGTGEYRLTPAAVEAYHAWFEAQS